MILRFAQDNGFTTNSEGDRRPETLGVAAYERSFEVPIAEPSLVHGFTGELVTRVGAQPKSIGLVLKRGMQHVHPEDQDVARFVVGGVPLRLKSTRELLWTARV